MNKTLIKNFITQLLKEDLPSLDITTNSLVRSDHRSGARIIAKQNGVLCGMDLAKLVFKRLDKSISFQTKFKDGTGIKKGDCLAVIKGRTRAILTGERSALNVLAYLSGIATMTQQYVSMVKKYNTAILDTRKTTPTLRWLEKYAVRCGGGINHRFNLSDMVIIKDNHLAARTKGLSIAENIKRVKNKTKKTIMIEVETVEQLTEAILSKPDMIMLDNMSPVQIKKAVLIRNRLNKKILLEASGGITLKTIQSVAKTGVDRISLGAITHSAPSIDLSLEMARS
ncbi:MAG: carboxylating nicotinate-nucleotide diphosphorylase [Candidatus Omnitrophota bacterium]